MSNTPETPQDDQNASAAAVTQDADESPATDDTATNTDVFSREYVEKLRGESADHRTKARDAEARSETLSRELFAEKVKATGRLADPTDLPYSAEALADPDVLNQQIDDLLSAKPHFANRRPVGNVGIGVKDSGIPADGSGWLSGLKQMI